MNEHTDPVAAMELMLADHTHPSWALGESVARYLCNRHQWSNPTSIPCAACSQGATEVVAIPVAILLAEVRAEVKVAAEEWFCDVSLDDLYVTKGWTAPRVVPPAKGGAA